MAKPRASRIGTFRANVNAGEGAAASLGIATRGRIRNIRKSLARMRNA